MQKIFPSLLGTLIVHAVCGAAFWALSHYVLVVQASLAADVISRTDGDPARIDVYLGDVGGEFLTAGVASLVVSAVLASAWLAMVHMNPPMGDRSARARRSSWAGLLVVALATTAGLFWWRVIGGPTAALVVPGLGTKAALIAAAAVAAGYWLNTALFAPAGTKIAVPGALLLGR